MDDDGGNNAAPPIVDHIAPIVVFRCDSPQTIFCLSAKP